MKRCFTNWAVGGALVVAASWPIGWPAEASGQVYPGWRPVLPMQRAAPTPGGELRNATRAIHQQAAMVRNAVRDWGYRASSASYQFPQALQDLQMVQFELQQLRGRVNEWLAWAGPHGSMAELGADLNIISDAVAPVQMQLSAGMFDRAEVIRMCRSVDKAVGEWDKEVTRRTAGLSFVW